MKKQNTDVMRSLVRALNLLDIFLQKEEELSISDLSEEMNLSASTVYRIVSTFSEYGYLIRNESNRKYFLGPKVIQLGRVGIKSLRTGIREYAKPYMDDIFNKFNETISLYLLSNHSRICIDVRESTQQLRDVVKIGESVPLSAGGIGNVFLAYMNKEESDAALPEMDELLKNKLEKIRRDKYFVSEGEIIIGIKALALPIFDSNNKVEYVLSLSGPKERFPEEKDHEKIIYLSQIAQKLSNILGNFEK